MGVKVSGTRAVPCQTPSTPQNGDTYPLFSYSRMQTKSKAPRDVATAAHLLSDARPDQRTFSETGYLNEAARA
jgi:hypothetical protein